MESVSAPVGRSSVKREKEGSFKLKVGTLRGSLRVSCLVFLLNHLNRSLRIVL